MCAHIEPTEPPQGYGSRQSCYGYPSASRLGRLMYAVVVIKCGQSLNYSLEWVILSGFHLHYPLPLEDRRVTEGECGVEDGLSIVGIVPSRSSLARR